MSTSNHGIFSWIYVSPDFCKETSSDFTMENGDFVKGKCTQMCPQKEIKMREKERLLHKLEIIEGTEKNPKADPRKMVKCFKRSAAGTKMESVENLRTADVLISTVAYLLEKVILNDKYSWITVYDFITDRLMSVRQDMVIQSLSKAPSISIMQPIVRFHAFAGYQLCEEPISNYDPKLNSKHLQEALKKCLVLYEDCAEIISRATRVGVSVKDEYEDIYASSRPNIEAIYILHNLGDSAAIMHALKLNKKWQTKNVKRAMKISLNWCAGNWLKVCRLMKMLPPLLAGVAILHLPEIRKKAFRTMSIAYNCRNLSFPFSELKQLLLYSNDQDLITDLNHYNITFSNDDVYFMRNSFREEAKTAPMRKESFITNKLKKELIPDIVLYGHF